MNFTDKYIKMCEQATEIQEEWKCATGDWFTASYFKKDGVFPTNSAMVVGYDSIPKDVIFLPLQHQLQEMKRDIPYQQLLSFLSFCKSDLYDEKDPVLWWAECYLFNELWLMFIMHKLYQKKWNNTKEVWE